MGEKITITPEHIWGDVEGFAVVTEMQGDIGRWQIHMTTILKRLVDGKLFMAHWLRGATEMQEHDYPGYAEECREITRTVTDYEPVRD